MLPLHIDGIRARLGRKEGDWPTARFRLGDYRRQIICHDWVKLAADTPNCLRTLRLARERPLVEYDSDFRDWFIRPEDSKRREFESRDHLHFAAGLG